jgi:16S rRNA (cytidine1402-2'-O)-methyltransferase
LKPSDSGTLYIVATPIGNLADISQRAIDVLGIVDTVAAEDTRHTSRLMQALGLSKKMLALHDHNELARHEGLLDRVATGESIALVSDAGTPLISDPGFVLVRELRARGRQIIPIPGPCALVAALSAAGLPTDRFLFQGFLPARKAGRRARLEALAGREETLVFYESPHRIRDTLAEIAVTLKQRQLILARELTKTFETFLDGTAADLLARMDEDPDQARGEFVVMVAGAVPRAGEEAASFEADALLTALLEEGVGVKQAASVASRVLGGAKKEWYARTQTLKDGD